MEKFDIVCLVVGIGLFACAILYILGILNVNWT